MRTNSYFQVKYLHARDFTGSAIDFSMQEYCDGFHLVLEASRAMVSEGGENAV